VKIYGGRAGYNSVTFTGEKYHVVARFKEGKITTETRRKNRDKKITIILSKIPFVRSFSMLFDLIIEYWRRFLAMVIVLFLMELLFNERSNSIFLYTIPINSLEMLLFFLVLYCLIIKSTSIGQYHAAEHQIANAFERDPNLTLEKVKKQPRTHNDCGTNLVISFFICYVLLFMIFGDSAWVLLVSWIIGYEVWRNEPKVIWNLILIIGKGAQYLLFTSKPKEKHLIVAMEAITRLEEKELANKK